MAIRELTPDEQRRIFGKRKPAGQRPRYYDANTGQFVEISFDFETFILLVPIGFRARIGQYLAAITAVDIGAGTMDDLRTKWLTQRKDTYQAAADLFGPTVTTYEDIRSDLIDAAVGFEDVSEYQLFQTDLAKVVGKDVDDFENISFQKNVYNTLKLRAAPAAPTTSPVQAELQSFIQAFLAYS